ncbi:MAG TPA: thioredoxin domain-containing protein [Polyangiaceae bacterium]
MTFAALLLAGCGGGHAPPPTTPTFGGSAIGTEPTQNGLTAAGVLPEDDPHGAKNAPDSIRFEDLPVVRLERSKVPLPSAANPSQGAPNAPVVIQIWSDFECPFCVRAHPVLKALVASYAGKVRLVWHDYPLNAHARARPAANAALEAFAQAGSEGFWKYHDLLYENGGALSDTELAGFAAKIGLDLARFRDALGSMRHGSEIQRDMALGDAIGVDGTPAFLVNDYFFIGAVPYDVMRVIVNRALRDAGK